MDKKQISCRLPRIRKRACRCYELAWRGWAQAFNAGEEWQLVHGIAKSVYGLQSTPEKKGLTYGHAWLEREGMVYCPVSDKLFTANEWRDIVGMVELQRFSDNTPAILASNTGNYGPWLESEIIEANLPE